MRLFRLRPLALTALLALAALVGGRAVAGPVQAAATVGQLEAAADDGQQPFVRAAPTDAAKTALRERGQRQTPLAKTLEAAALTALTLAPVPPSVRVSLYLIHPHVAVPARPSRCPRGPPAA